MVAWRELGFVSASLMTAPSVLQFFSSRIMVPNHSVDRLILVIDDEEFSIEQSHLLLCNCEISSQLNDDVECVFTNRINDLPGVRSGRREVRARSFSNMSSGCSEPVDVWGGKDDAPDAPQLHPTFTFGGRGCEDAPYTELWRACAGPLVSLHAGDRVQLPTGHIEQECSMTFDLCATPLFLFHWLPHLFADAVFVVFVCLPSRYSGGESHAIDYVGTINPVGTQTDMVK